MIKKCLSLIIPSIFLILHTKCESLSKTEIIPLTSFDTVFTDYNNISGIKFNTKYKFYLLRMRGTNEEKALFVHNQFAHDSLITNESKKYNTYTLFFFAETARTNLQSLQKDPDLILTNYNEDEVAEMVWDDGVLKVQNTLKTTCIENWD